MDDLYWRLVDVLQALAAALLVGGTYGLMCVGLGIIFGVMRVVNFGSRRFQGKRRLTASSRSPAHTHCAGN